MLLPEGEGQVVSTCVSMSDAQEVETDLEGSLVEGRVPRGVGGS